MEFREIIRITAEAVLAIYAGVMLWRSCRWEKKAVDLERAFRRAMKDMQLTKFELAKKNIELAKCRRELDKI